MTYNEVINVGPFAVDLGQNSLIHNGESTYLGPLRASLLAYLCKHINKVVARDDLADSVWGRSVSDHTINQHISQLRKSLQQLSREDLTISTIPKKGYIARCESAAVAASEAMKSLFNTRVLVIESSSSIAEDFSGYCLENGLHNVDVVTNINDACRMMASREFDLLVIDAGISNYQGLQLIRNIRTGGTVLRPDVKIVTTFREANPSLMGFNILMDIQALMLKPVSSDQFRRQLEAAVHETVDLKPTAAYQLVPFQIELRTSSVLNFA